MNTKGLVSRVPTVVLGATLIALSASVLGTGGTILMNVPYAHAATLNCAGVVGACFGTNGDDVMTGDGGSNIICGLKGSDRITLSGGNDRAAGNEGFDIIDGGYGDDYIAGGGLSAGAGCGGVSGGSDYLNGGPGNDKIFHGTDDHDIQPDGGKDTVNCGPGNDEAWINTRFDGDVAINCEIVHAGSLPPPP